MGFIMTIVPNNNLLHHHHPALPFPQLALSYLPLAPALSHTAPFDSLTLLPGLQIQWVLGSIRSEPKLPLTYRVLYDSIPHSQHFTSSPAECWAGNDLALATSKGTSTKCNMECEGDSSQYCGGCICMSLFVYYWQE